MQSFELEGTDEHRQLIPPQHHQHNHNDKNHTFTMEGPPPSATAAINDKPSTTHYKKGSRRIRTGTRIDLAFPTVIITPSNKRRRKKQWGQYRFLAVIALCMTMIFQFFKRIMLPLPTGDKHLDLSRIKSIENLSVDAIDSWCLAVSNSTVVIW